MAEPVDAPGSSGEQDPNLVRATVNGRVFRIERDSGLIVKGPKSMRGEYLSNAQLERIISNPDYHGHLFLAVIPNYRHLAEAEFELWEYNMSKGIFTLVEGMYITFEGQSGWRISDVGQTTVEISNGQIVKQVRRSRIEQEAALDPVLTSTHLFEDAPIQDPVPRTFTGDLTIPDEQIERIILSWVDANIDRLVEAVIERRANTSGAADVDLSDHVDQ